MDNMYFVAKSSDSADFYPTNTAASFKIKLYKPLILKGSWEVGLLGFTLTNVETKEVPDTMLIESNLCQYTTVVGGRKRVPVLRHIFKAGSNMSWEFDSPIYMPVNQPFVETIEIYINSGQGSQLSFESGTSTCILHLRQSE